MQTVSFTQYQTANLRYEHLDVYDYFSNLSTHTHTGWEFLFVKSGILSYTIDGNVFDIGPGSLIVTRPGAIHTLSPKDTIHYERHNLIVAEHLLSKDMVERIPPGLDVLNVSGNANIANVYEKFRYYCANLQEALLESTFCMLINELLVDIYIAAQTPSRSVSSQSNAVITKVVNFIKDHIREPLTVHTICDSLFISRSYLHYCFTKHLNVTPKQYIMLQKLQMAHHALLNGETPTKVCREYGFHNYSTFYRNYQKVYGYHPSDSPQQSLQKIEL